MVWFDHNATTPLAPVAREAFLTALDERWHNPSSPSAAAARVRNALEAARARLAAILRVDPARVVFTSGATESNNAILRDATARLRGDQLIAISAIEHPCVYEAAHKLAPGRVRLLPVTPEGAVDLAVAERILADEPIALVSVMAANNETGVLQPWSDLATLCADCEVPFHCDAAQWFGKLPADGFTPCAWLTGSGHKFGGPKGVGFLVRPEGRTDFHAQWGGAQENNHRGGTENYPAVAAMLAALEDRAQPTADAIANDRKRARTFAHTVVEAIPGTRVLGEAVDRLPNTVGLLMPAADNLRWVRLLDKAGFAISTGAACATGKEGPSHVLAAMGIDGVAQQRMLRVSAAPGETDANWEALADAFAAAWRQIDATPRDDGLTTVIDI